MKLLITTQTVDKNDPVLGFFTRWIEEFATQCESVEVICLNEGAHDLPSNVHVHSLGKEKATKEGKELPRGTYAFRFFKLILQLRNKHDAVFVHMNPEYVILGSGFWHLYGKRVGLWYLHKSVDVKLRMAEFFTDVIFTASKESFRLKSKKVKIVGHGISLDPSETIASKKTSQTGESVYRFVSIGRISPAKKVDVLLEALGFLQAQGVVFTFDAIGTAGRPEDKKYEIGLIDGVAHSALKGSVHFLGPKTHAEVAAVLPSYDLFLHASTGTGSVDKAVLEALLSGVPVVSSSPAFRELLEPFGLFAEENTGEAIAAVATTFLNRTDQATIRDTLREKVAREYSLSALITRILSVLQ
jgi:glycosyltransferase involved in cell wall biosynthesis